MGKRSFILIFLAVLLFIMPGVLYAGVAVTYQLPTTGPLPKTYRVTIAMAPQSDPDWIVATFVAGQPRTVTTANNGAFTETWNGLDDNFMPVLPGNYVAKGIYMPAEVWKIDGQYHALIPEYKMSITDTWSPTSNNDTKYPYIIGHIFDYMQDIQAGPNGKCAFIPGYHEAEKAFYIADLTKPNGYDQVVTAYNRMGWCCGGNCAYDGEVMWVACQIADPPYITRADGVPFGASKTALGTPCTYTNVMPPDMYGYKYTASSRRVLYAVQPAPLNGILVLNGDTGATLKAQAVNTNPRSVRPDRTSLGSKLIAMYYSTSLAQWVVGTINLSNSGDSNDGIPQGSWTQLFVLSGFSNPVDIEKDTAGYYYVTDPDNQRVCKLNSSGVIVYTYGGTAQTPGTYDKSLFMYPKKLA